MSAETVEPLSKVDSAISGLSSSPPEEKGAVKGHRRASSSAAGVYNIADLGELYHDLCSCTFHRVVDQVLTIG